MKMAVYAKCGNQRCYQERKQLRKELERGRKNLISYIGLECVIESVFGSEFVQKVSPFKAAQDGARGHEPCDWLGEKENCVMCAARQEIVQESIARHEAYIDTLEETKDTSRHVTSKERVLRAQQWLADSVPLSGIQPTKKTDQPLDLSKNGLDDDLETPEEVEEGEDEEDKDDEESMLKVPAVMVQRTKSKTSRSCRINGSSTYTQEDLKLALKEVKLGKIGTRRASVLYGIPRSTIRNHLNRSKANKQAEDTEEATRSTNVEEVEMKIPKRLPYISEPINKRVKLERPLIPESSAAFPFTAFFQQYHQQAVNYEDCSTDEVVGKLRNFLQGRSAGGSGKLPKSAGFDHGLDQALVRELVMSCTKVGSLGSDEDMQHRENYARDLGKDKLPNQVFQHLIGHLLETEKVHLLSGKKDVRQHIGIASVIRKPSSPKQDQDVKVPSFKPVVCDIGGAQEMDKMQSCDSSSSSHGSPTKSYSPSSNNNNNQASHCASYDSMVPASSKRPKRGRYRCYDRDSLIQAVNAVQRGEMSVTRAGNVFGVPHSTLEYKVKERHLKRMAKKGPQGPQQQQQQQPKQKQPVEKGETSQTPILGVPPGVHLHDGHNVPSALTSARPYESFAEKLRAMSEKQALQNSYSYLRQQLESQPALLASHGINLPAGALSLSESDRYRLEEAQSALAVQTQLALSEQWAQWLHKPVFSSPFFNIYTPPPAALGIDPTGMFYRLDNHKQSSPNSSKKPSVSDAINRLVEAHLYSSLYAPPFGAGSSDHGVHASMTGESTSSQEADPSDDQRSKRRATVEDGDESPQPKKALKA